MPFIERTIGYNYNGSVLYVAPGVLGDLEIRTICFQVVRRSGNYFQGSGEQPHSSMDLRSPAESKQ